jgi:copper resistance protein B
MRRLALMALAPLAVASAASAQPADSHAHHQHGTAQPSAESADPHADHTAPAPPAAKPDPHARHAPAAGQPADRHTGHTAAPIASTSPPIPTDREADRHYGRAPMDAAREALRREHGDIRWSKVMIERLEVRPGSGPDAYFWDGSISYGGDVNRFVLRSEGEGAEELESVEFRALYSRAVSPFFNLQAGVRQDFEPRSRTYATLGVEGLAPYFFEVEGALFLSDRGDLTGRFEGALDWRLTQQLILEPRIEANLSAQDVPSLRVGSGLSTVGLGLRLRYQLVPEFAPYVGVNHERSFGDTARLRRTAREDHSETQAVVGFRTWF